MPTPSSKNESKSLACIQSAPDYQLHLAYSVEAPSPQFDLDFTVLLYSHNAYLKSGLVTIMSSLRKDRSYRYRIYHANCFKIHNNNCTTFLLTYNNT